MRTTDETGETAKRRGTAREKKPRQQAEGGGTATARAVRGKTETAREAAVGGRRRRAVVEAARDEEWARWIGRFRFVTAEALGARFGVTGRAANRRVAWLVAEDWVVRVPRRSPASPAAIVLSRRGATWLGLPRRKPPKRVELEALEHELAIIRWVSGLEAAAAQRDDGARVLTERECRHAETAEDGRYSVPVTGLRGTVEKRWPDVVLELPERAPRAFEIEFAVKSSERLRSIVHGYRNTPRYSGVTVLVESPALAARLRRLALSEGAAAKVAVRPWMGAPPEVRDAIARLEAPRTLPAAEAA